MEKEGLSIYTQRELDLISQASFLGNFFYLSEINNLTDYKNFLKYFWANEEDTDTPPSSGGTGGVYVTQFSFVLKKESWNTSPVYYDITEEDIKTQLGKEINILETYSADVIFSLNDLSYCAEINIKTVTDTRNKYIRLYADKVPDKDINAEIRFYVPKDTDIDAPVRPSEPIVIHYIDMDKISTQLYKENWDKDTYSYTMGIENLSEEDRVDVVFNLSSIETAEECGIYASMYQTENQLVIYTKEIPTVDLNVDIYVFKKKNTENEEETESKE